MKKILCLSLLVSLGLVGCGKGDSNTGPVTNLIPPTKTDNNLSKTVDGKTIKVENEVELSLNTKGDYETTNEEVEAAESAGIEIPDWFNKDLKEDGIAGVSTNRVYREFNIHERSKPIVVAVIDSGVDIFHEDLQGKIWVNEDEIPNNGIDDDNNGFIDDVNGWSFIGGYDENGNVVNVDADTLEVTREYKRYLTMQAEGVDFTPQQESYYKEVEKKYNQASATAKFVVNTSRKYAPILEENFGLSLRQLTTDKVLSLETEDEQVQEAIDKIAEVLGMFRSGLTLKRLVGYFGDQVDYYYNLEFNPRKTIVKDDPSNLHYTGYGNHDVKGPDSSHGTHVAGIIAATRNNGIGMNGVAENVKIMSVRAVPNGDERDKDVANAIRYAVDNGARIINTSFGKGYSPHKEYVDAAVKYAEEQGVLIINAAGNDDNDIDLVDTYPNKYYQGERFSVPFRYVGESSTFMTIGASTWDAGLNLVAYFSNYGKQNVDLFSPGFQIYSTTPENTYAAYNGTSMAAPVAAGVATLVLSQYPQITGQQLKKILMKSVVPLEDVDVRMPGSDTFDVPELFGALSVSGGLVNAYKAMTLVDDLANNHLEY